MNRPLCQEKQRLVNEYQNATRAYSDAVAQLLKTIGTASKAEYDNMYRVTEALRFEARRAKDELDAHVGSHEC